MNKIRITLLSFIFLLGFFYQPVWVYNNFWFKADFYESLPFEVPYWSFLLTYSIISTFLVELVIRFVKKYL